MKKIFQCFVIFCLLFLTSCKSYLAQDEHPLHHVFDTHEKIELRRSKMKLVAGGTSSADNIEKIALHYIIFKKMKIPEARALAISSIEKFLQLINEDEQIRKYLAKHPLTFKDLKYNIGFGSIEGGFQEPPYIAHLYLDEGVFHYCYQDELFGRFIDEEDVEEPYEEAKKAIQS